MTFSSLAAVLEAVKMTNSSGLSDEIINDMMKF